MHRWDGIARAPSGGGRASTCSRIQYTDDDCVLGVTPRRPFSTISNVGNVSNKLWACSLRIDEWLKSPTYYTSTPV